jgi:hypothetical protein
VAGEYAELQIQNALIADTRRDDVPDRLPILYAVAKIETPVAHPPAEAQMVNHHLQLQKYSGRQRSTNQREQILERSQHILQM